MAQSIEVKKEKQRLNLQRWRENNREYYNKLQRSHSIKYQQWRIISRSWLKGFPPDLFV